MKKRYKWLILALVVIGLIVGFDRISYDYEIHTDIIEHQWFEYDGNQMAGSLFVPEDKDSFPVVVFVHGDGYSDRTESGEYNMLLNAFLDKGIGCYSYDKAGVGDSEGNWLDQSMVDRAKEVLAAVSMLKDRSDVEEVGLMGLSQGGWVLSEVALLEKGIDSEAEVSSDRGTEVIELSVGKSMIDFMIVISGAIDWMEQSAYMDEAMLASAELTSEEKEVFRDYIDQVNLLIYDGDYESYVEFLALESPESTPMSEERFGFVHRNMDANGIEGIKVMDMPFLGVFGAKDQNVNVVNSYEVYGEIFNEMGKENSELILYEDGDHALLKSKYSVDNMNPFKMMEMFIVGEGIYVDGYMERLGDWVNEVVESSW